MRPSRVSTCLTSLSTGAYVSHASPILNRDLAAEAELKLTSPATTGLVVRYTYGSRKIGGYPMPSRRCKGSGARGQGLELLNPTQLPYPDIQLRLPRHEPLRNWCHLWTGPHRNFKIIKIYITEYNMPQNSQMLFFAPFPARQSITLETTTTYAKHPVPKTCKNRGKTCKNLQKRVKTARKLAKTGAKSAKTCQNLPNTEKPAPQLPFSRPFPSPRPIPIMTPFAHMRHALWH